MFNKQNMIDILYEFREGSITERQACEQISNLLPTDDDVQKESEKWFLSYGKELRQHDWKNGVYWLRDMWKNS